MMKQIRVLQLVMRLFIRGEEMKTERLNIRVTPEQKQKLKELADSENRTISNYILYLVNKKIKEKEN